MTMACWRGHVTTDSKAELKSRARARGGAKARQTPDHLAAFCITAFFAALFGAAATRADDVDIAMYPKSAERPAALSRLRDRGPAGLDALLRRAELLERKSQETPNDSRVGEALAAISDAMNQVGATRYCRQSGLYWYTDMAKAKAAAQESGRPILALKMLGNLTDELSCANSRFFRTTLYANTEISQFLRENFVLTWSSIRPVPIITIDFRDGRKIERTITGNSIHYVLTSDGQVVDALPGLYGPSEFLAQIQRARDAAVSISQLPPTTRNPVLNRYHHAALARIAQRWRADLPPIHNASLTSPATVTPVSKPRDSAAAAGTPARARDMQAAIAKLRGDTLPASPIEPVTANRITASELADDGGELPALATLGEEFASLEQRMNDAMWNQVADQHSADATLDDASRKLIEAQRPNAAIAGRLAITKRVVENPLLRLLANLRQSTALDTVQNEYMFHRRLHFWLIENPRQADDLHRLNERVYAELFLTPSTDPWLGLGQPDVYAAIPNNGVVESVK